MLYTKEIVLSFLAFTAHTISAYSYSSNDALFIRDLSEREAYPIHEVGYLHERDPYPELNYLHEREAYAYPDPKGVHTTTPKPALEEHSDPSSSGKKPSKIDALKKAAELLEKLKKGALKISDSDAAKVAGMACDVNSIASMFLSGTTVTEVSNGVSAVCQAGQIVTSLAGLGGSKSTRRWEHYKRAAAAEANAWAVADAYGEHQIMLAARYAEGLGY
ncbi:hypothetical protein MMC19_006698 [Ptychographa xylographoides]|nr:hypothetical protein [Ptychographa xylographoides]